MRLHPAQAKRIKGRSTPECGTRADNEKEDAAMSEAAFLALTGPVLWHHTPRANLAGILRYGILRPVKLCEVADEEPALLRRRTDALVLRMEGARARLSDRKALMGADPKTFLDGHTLESWGAQMDRRLFLWPSIDQNDEDIPPPGSDTVAIAVDAAKLYRSFGHEIDLAPINTGSALIKPALRGDWIYVPAAEAEIFPQMRVKRGLVKRPDRVVEVSLRGDLTLPRLSLVLAQPLPTAG